MEDKIVLNMAECLNCRQILVSANRHDYRTCECENETMVDGGTAYLRRGGAKLNLIRELSVALRDGKLRWVKDPFPETTGPYIDPVEAGVEWNGREHDD